MQFKEGSLVVVGFVSRPTSQRTLTVLSVAALVRDGFDRTGREDVRYAEYPRTGYRVFVVPTAKHRFTSTWMTEIFDVDLFFVDTVARQDGVIVSDMGSSYYSHGFARVDQHLQLQEQAS